MTKVKKYLTIEELIDVIKSKGIIISDEEKTRETLKQNNYYVIMGYKTLFIDNNRYKENVTFENIYNLYKFDRELKLILLDSLLDIESIIKNAIINKFCSKYGYTEKEYLDMNNYDTNHKYLSKMLNIFNKQIIDKKDNKAVEYYMNSYGYIPFWVIGKILTFGLIKEIYAVMKLNDKNEILKDICNFNNMKFKDLFMQIQLLVDMRNKASHDEIVFNDLHRRIILSKSTELNKFSLPNKNSGLNDLLGLLISIKSVLPKNNYNNLIDKITFLIYRFLNINSIVTKEELLNEMHLPINYEDLKW